MSTTYKKDNSPLTPPPPFTFRGVQLDLARQMETIGFIHNFIDFITLSGYNTLVLYLEGLVRTASFPYPPDGSCYTPADIKKSSGTLRFSLHPTCMRVVMKHGISAAVRTAGSGYTTEKPTQGFSDDF